MTDWIAIMYTMKETRAVQVRPTKAVRKASHCGGSTSPACRTVAAPSWSQSRTSSRGRSTDGHRTAVKAVVLALNPGKPCPGVTHVALAYGSSPSWPSRSTGSSPDTSSCVGYSTYPARPAHQHRQRNHQHRRRRRRVGGAFIRRDVRAARRRTVRHANREPQHHRHRCRPQQRIFYSQSTGTAIVAVQRKPICVSTALGCAHRGCTSMLRRCALV